MPKAERVGGTNELIHVKSMEILENETHSKFDALVNKLLKDAPEVHKTDGIKKQVEFKFQNSTVSVSRIVSGDDDFPSVRSSLQIVTPIIVDNIQTVPLMGHIYPNRPHELVEFESDSRYGILSVTVRAVNQIDNPDFGLEITIDRYTAGGLLSPINTKGEGMIKAFRDVIALLQNVNPKSPDHLLAKAA